MMKFQSAPRSRDRGDSPPASPLRPAYRFNPRPGLATGATGAGRDGNFIYMFQSAPRSRDRGRPRALLRRHQTVVFQSAPRSRDRGDGTTTVMPAPSTVFQSAPGLATGGDR